MTLFQYKARELFLRIRSPLLMISTWTAFLCCVATVLFVGYDVGFKITLEQKKFFFSIFKIILLILSLISLLRIVNNFNELVQKNKKIEWLSLILLFSAFILVFEFGSLKIFSHIPFEFSYWLVITVLLFFSVIEITRDAISVLTDNVDPVKIFVTSFLFLITVGTTLLMLPNSTYHGISFVDALFTTTSAVCVTGLNSVQFDQTFTLSGQIIVLLMIQLGGLGVVTITTFFAIFFLDGISVNSEFMIKDIITGKRSGNLIPLVKKIITYTFIIELTGAVVIYFFTRPYLDMNEADKIFFALFHAISAFCNAGFSTLHDNLADPSIVRISPFFVIISLLIVAGGIGFPIISNIVKVFKHRYYKIGRILRGRKYRKYVRDWDMNSVIVLRTTGMLLLLGTLYFFIFEGSGLLKQFSGFEKIAQAFFHAVTPRTAGYNSVDLSNLKPVTFLVFIILMWIGAAPQSTGGGIKVTTFALLVRNFTHLIKGTDRIDFIGREVTSRSVTRAFATISLSLVFIMLAFVAMVSIEPKLDPGKILFEIVSAIGTVGLSMGITQDMLPANKLIITLMMFAGRVGVISFLSSFMKYKREQRYCYPKEDIMIS